jgi:hypothetical protein
MPIQYEGYTKLTEFGGFVQTPQGTIRITALDATGDRNDQMIIYEGGEHLGAPQILGEFLCRWAEP